MFSYVYFVSYYLNQKSNLGFGNYTITCNFRIKTDEDIRKIEEIFKTDNEQDLDNALILNFQLLKRKLNLLSFMKTKTPHR